MSDWDEVLFEKTWTDDEADELSKSVLNKDPLTEYGKVAPSLLSAPDIVEYVRKTAMISPFKATKRTLKHASYEATIGSNAYCYGKQGLQRIKLTEDGYLRVPANEIVFIESGVTFRLPRYIAARFNLQITHVHRGMLLGTGPLVDPGFRGKLLIPLHNLTSEDYYIHKNDGFIWIEFTRTTYDEVRDIDSPYGDYPEYKQLTDGRRWLHKAAYSKHLNREVPIRSSILPIVNRVEKQANKAFRIARDLRRTAFIGGLALLVTFTLIMLGEIYTNRNFMQSAYGRIEAKSAATAGLGSGIADTAVNSGTDLDRFRATVNADIEALNAKVAHLNRELAVLLSEGRLSATPSADLPTVAE